MCKRMRLRWSLACALGLAVIAGFVPKGYAGCLVESSTNRDQVGLVVHLSPECSLSERESHVVQGEALVDVLAKGHPVDLVGVIVRGDLDFDRLVPSSIMSQAGGSPPQVSGQQNSGQRVVRGALTIRNSVVEGGLRHQSAASQLRFEGTVDFQGSRFKEGVDLSRSIFKGTAEFSGATFEKEAFFVQGEFVRGLGCQGTTFGPSTRFHRSIFHGQLDCTGALFDGMAELLEVKFEGPALFERSRFGLGTGFSGSRFRGQANFREAIFSRETFFAFTIFESDTIFSNAQFLGPADFSQAEFTQPDNLSGARFDQPPLMTQVKRIMQDQGTGVFDSKAANYFFTVLLLIAVAALLAYIVKMK